MKPFSLGALGMAILTLAGCGMASPSPDEGIGQQENETKRIVKLILSQAGTKDEECKQEWIELYQDKVDRFNASHKVMQVELIVWDGIGEDKGGGQPHILIAPHCLADDVWRYDEYETYTDEERIGATMIEPRNALYTIRIKLVYDEEQLLDVVRKVIMAFNATHAGNIRIDFRANNVGCDGAYELTEEMKNHGRQLFRPICGYEITKENINNDVYAIVSRVLGLTLEEIETLETPIN